MTDPKPPQFNSPLVLNREYHLFRRGRYLGTGTYKDDPRIGLKFIREEKRPRGGIIKHVYSADKWTII
jgi:hypothetical protein